MELVAMLVVAGVVISMAFGFFGNVLRAYIAGTESADNASRASLVIERMARDLRSIRSATTNELTPSASQISFVEQSSGNVIGYQVSGGILYRTVTPSGTPIALADSISALGFGYLTADGRSELTSPGTSVALIAYISSRFTVTSNNVTAGYSSTVRPTGF